MSAGTATPGALEAQVAGARWYHTIELPGGVVTPGEYDLRAAARRVPMPQRLDGLRCLDVGTRDGFWAFEMERRGAAEVVGIDLADIARLDWPHPRPQLDQAVLDELDARGRTFEIAHAALGSRVERRDLSVYDLSPELAGEFDMVVIGTLMLHLRDPVGALAAIRRVVRPDGRFLANEAISLTLSLLQPRRPAAVLIGKDEPFWWTPNVAALRREVTAAGFEILASGGPYLLPVGPGFRPAPFRSRVRAGARVVEELILRRGMPHAWVLSRPAA